MRVAPRAEKAMITRIVQVVQEEQENMSAKFDISFANSASLENALAIVLQASGEAQAVAGASEADPGGVIERASKISGFSAKSMATLDVIAPQGSAADRLLVIGLGKPSKLVAHDWLRAGGTATAHFKKADKVGRGGRPRRCLGPAAARVHGRRRVIVGADDTGGQRNAAE